MANGLFSTPQQIAALERAQRIAASASPYAQVGGGMFDVGHQLGGVIGRGLGGKGNIESATMQMAKKREELLKGLDTTKPETFRATANALIQEGDYQAGSALLSQYLQFPKTQAKEYASKKGADGYLYYVEGPQKGERVLPEVEKTEKEKEPKVWYENIMEKGDLVTTKQVLQKPGELPPAKEGFVYTTTPKEKWRGVEGKQGGETLSGWWSKYEKSLKNEKFYENKEKLDTLQLAATQVGPFSGEAMQTALADLFGGQSRAIAELQRFANAGTLPQRVVNTASRFFQGDYSDESKQAALLLAGEYRRDKLQKTLTSVNKRYKKFLGGSFEEIKEDNIHKRDIKRMSAKELKNAVLPVIKQLDPIELAELEYRLNQLGL